MEKRKPTSIKLQCVFKPKGYNIVNAGLEDRQGSHGYVVQYFGELTPPSPSLQLAVSVCGPRQGHMHAFFGATSRRSGRLDALALLPYSWATFRPSYLLFPPQVPVLMVALPCLCGQAVPGTQYVSRRQPVNKKEKQLFSLILAMLQQKQDF